jgi:2-phospho-L-lactate/phosphoenolpyruvate guanylyltransferase
LPDAIIRHRRLAWQARGFWSLESVDRSGTWAVLPVKTFRLAKQRLAGVLAGKEREKLARAMAEDVLRALAASPDLAGILLVTGDPEARRLAARYGARVLQDEERGHTAASSLGARTLAREGVSAMLQVPADIPLVNPEDIGALLAVHGKAPAITLAPSRDERGTNAVACSPPDVMPLRFGADSFVGHVRRARADGIEPQTVRRPGLALDLDTPDDLAALLVAPSETRTHAYLTESGIGRRISQFKRAQSAPP